MNNFVITGASSGLGKALAHRLTRVGRTFLIGGPPTYSPIEAVREPGGLRRAVMPELQGGPYCDINIDLADPASFQKIVERVNLKFPDKRPAPDQNFLINCAGVNYIEAFAETDFGDWDRLMALNARAPIELTQRLLKWLTGGIHPGTVVNVISNASHVPMTNSVCYNASKGALHIATLAMGREIGKTHGITVFGVSPNKMGGTQMSAYIEGAVPRLRGWTPEQAAAYQAAALPVGEATPPGVVADFIAYLLSSPERHRYLHQTVIPYGG